VIHAKTSLKGLILIKPFGANFFLFLDMFHKFFLFLGLYTMNSASFAKLVRVIMEHLSKEVVSYEHTGPYVTTAFSLSCSLNSAAGRASASTTVEELNPEQELRSVERLRAQPPKKQGEAMWWGDLQ
jgi:predicted anti-sigma-YlaC factor YlaD